MHGTLAYRGRREELNRARDVEAQSHTGGRRKKLPPIQKSPRGREGRQRRLKAGWAHQLWVHGGEGRQRGRGRRGGNE